MDYRQFQQPGAQFFPGFPGFPSPTPPNDYLERRIEQIERTLDRHERRLNRLHRRVRRLEQQFGYPYSATDDI